MTYVKPLQEDIVLGSNGPVIDRMSKTVRLRMVQCTSSSKEIQLSRTQQCAPLQRLSKKRSLFTSQ